MLEFLQAAHLEFQTQETDEFQRNVLAVDVVIKVKQVDLDAQLVAVVQCWTLPDIGHALQHLAVDMGQHGIGAVVRQQQLRVNLAHIGCGEAQSAPIVETMHNLALDHVRTTHAVHRIHHPAGSYQSTHNSGAHRSIRA